MALAGSFLPSVFNYCPLIRIIFGKYETNLFKRLYHSILKAQNYLEQLNKMSCQELFDIGYKLTVHQKHLHYLAVKFTNQLL